MKDHLEKVRRAYDLTVEQYRQGIDPLQDVPSDIKNTPFFKALLADDADMNSGATAIREYLAPVPGMKFLDAGSSANLANYRLDSWPSTYYGVDISPALINAMKGFVTHQQINIGGLYVAEITGMPFEACFFDIAAVIGVLEYCTLEYIKIALIELNRVLKPESRVVLDIPDRNHPYAGDLMKLEQFLGRPNYHHSRSDFEKLLASVFSIERVDDSRVMLVYYLHTKKTGNDFLGGENDK